MVNTLCLDQHCKSRLRSHPSISLRCFEVVPAQHAGHHLTPLSQCETIKGKELSHISFLLLPLKNAATCSCRVTKNLLSRSPLHTNTPISVAYLLTALYSSSELKSLNRNPTVVFIRSPSSCHKRIWSTTVGGTMVVVLFRICGCA